MVELGAPCAFENQHGTFDSTAGPSHLQIQPTYMKKKKNCFPFAAGKLRWECENTVLNLG